LGIGADAPVHRGAEVFSLHQKECVSAVRAKPAMPQKAATIFQLAGKLLLRFRHSRHPGN
jgi:hypothetical protein